MRNRKSQIKEVYKTSAGNIPIKMQIDIVRSEVDDRCVFFLDMYKALLKQDMVRHYGDPKSFGRDFDTLISRSGHEGFSFFTKTLPTLGKALDCALTSGVLTTPKAFKTAPGKRSPRFLQVLFELVFDEDGLLKSEPRIDAVKDLRQILYLCYKYEVEYHETVIDDYLTNFKQVDIELGDKIPQELSNIDFYLLDVARTLLSDLFSEGSITRDDCLPGHGPGAVATGEKNWEKMNFKRKYKNLHEKFPCYLFYYANAADLASSVAHYHSLEERQSGVSKVVLVPKDSRGPRMICMEPLEFQYIQQGLAKAIVSNIETHRMTRGRVNFASQEVNRALALDGSRSGDVVTLDMKEASDRVSTWLVRELFSGSSLWPLLEATRSEFTRLPSGEEIRLRKFAPMGSALCFPIESLVHWSLAVSTLHVYDELPMEKALSAVYVYGDDIVIKGQNHESLFAAFPHFKLKFNEEKCCTSGIFRESCGMDAVLGEAVIPTKVKKPIPVSPYDANAYVSYIGLSNALWKDAYYSTSDVVDEKLRSVYGEIPRTNAISDCPGLVDPRSSGFPRGSNKWTKFQRRWNSELQRCEYRVKKLKTFKIYSMEMETMSSADRAKAITEFGYSRDRSEYHRKVMTKGTYWGPFGPEYVAGIYTIPHRIKIQQGWSSQLV